MADAAIPMSVPDQFARRGHWRGFRDPAVEAGFREWHCEEILPVAPPTPPSACIQAQCQPGGILLSSSSSHLLKDEVECELLGEVTVKGVHFPISIYVPRTPADRGSV
ncbi:MAG TPA: hypothetical protein VJ782_07845 [Aeromicrobium sp.]|nr:hypothetical protein [Aeromicrobium sp.]